MADAAEATPKSATYKYNSKVYNASEWVEHLKDTQRKSKCAWWTYFTVALIAGGAHLVCKLCGVKFAVKNPSQTATDHFCGTKGCSHRHLYKKDVMFNAAVTHDEPSGSGAGPGPSTGASSTKRACGAEDVRAFCLPASNQSLFVKHIARFLYKTNTALHLVEHPDMRAVGSTAGATLPSRKVLATRMLDEAYADTKAEVDEVCKDAGGMAAIASDGWKKHAAGQ
ncbi:hypothetical protein TSOC_013859, partial [Tetrabaena socialis]